MLILPGFCCPFGLFHRFWGVLRCLSQLSIDEIKTGQSCFERPVPQGRFLAEIQIRCSMFPSNAKEDSPLVSFSSRLGKIFLLSSPIRTIFASLLELSTLRRNLFPSFRLRHSWKSTLMVLHYNEASKCSRGVVGRGWHILTEIFDCGPVW